MRQYLVISLIASALALFTLAGRSRPVLVTGSPGPAVRYSLDVRDNPALRLHIVRIDLTSADVALSAVAAGPGLEGTEWTTSLQTVRTIAERERFDVAVNGDFFSHDMGELEQWSKYRTGAGARTMGPLVSDGRTVASRVAGPYSALLVDGRGRCSIGTFEAVPAGARQFLCGNVELVRNGKRVVAAASEADACTRAPRTAIGLDRDGKTLTLVVIDGRRADFSAGMTLAEVADELVRLGCDSGLNLDGGGSSTLVFRDAGEDACRVVNCPSDGHQLSDSLSFERPVASALGIRLTPRTTAVAASR
jgi:hypothetical protein